MQGTTGVPVLMSLVAALLFGWDYFGQISACKIPEVSVGVSQLVDVHYFDERSQRSAVRITSAHGMDVVYPTLFKLQDRRLEINGRYATAYWVIPGGLFSLPEQRLLVALKVDGFFVFSKEQTIDILKQANRSTLIICILFASMIVVIFISVALNRAPLDNIGEI